MADNPLSLEQVAEQLPDHVAAMESVLPVKVHALLSRPGGAGGYPESALLYSIHPEVALSGEAARQGVSRGVGYWGMRLPRECGTFNFRYSLDSLPGFLMNFSGVSSLFCAPAHELFCAGTTLDDLRRALAETALPQDDYASKGEEPCPLRNLWRLASHSAGRFLSPTEVYANLPQERADVLSAARAYGLVDGRLVDPPRGNETPSFEVRVEREKKNVTERRDARGVLLSQLLRANSAFPYRGPDPVTLSPLVCERVARRVSTFRGAEPDNAEGEEFFL